MKTLTLEKTSHDDLQRIVDREGNWSHYLHVPSKKVLRGVTFILDEGYNKPALQFYYKNNTTEQIAEKLEKARIRGERVDRFIETALALGGKISRDLHISDRTNKLASPLSNDEWDAFLSFSSFWNRHDPVLVGCQQSVFNVEEGYAGTLDLLLILRKACDVRECKCDEWIGKIGLYDLKVTAGIWDSHGAQVAAYAKADNVNEYLPKGAKGIHYTAVLRLGTEHKKTGGYQVAIYGIKDTLIHYSEFIAARTIHNAWYKEMDLDGSTKEIPDEVELSVTTLEEYEKASKQKGRKKAVAKKAPAKKAKATRAKKTTKTTKKTKK